MIGAHTAAIAVIIKAAGVVLQALMFVFIANKLSPEDVGVFSSVFVFWSLVRMLGPIGLDQIAVRDIASALSQNAPEIAGGLCRFISLRTLYISLVLAAATAALLLAVFSWQASPIPLPFVLEIVIGVPAFAMMGSLAGQLRGLQKPIGSQAAESLGLHGISLTAFVIIDKYDDFGLEAALIAQAASAWAVVLLYLWLWRSSSPRIHQRLEKPTKAELWRESFQVWQALLVTGLAVRVPTYLCLLILGPAQTALFEIALRFSALTSIVTTGVSSTISPIIAGYSACGDHKGLANVTAFGVWSGFITALCTLIAMLVLGPWLLTTFFPPVYREAYTPLIIMCVGATINASLSIASTVFIMTHGQKLLRSYAIGRLFANVVLGSAFAYVAGLEGLCLGIIAGGLVQDIGLTQRLRDKMNDYGFLSPRGAWSFVRAFWPTTQSVKYPQ